MRSGKIEQRKRLERRERRNSFDELLFVALCSLYSRGAMIWEWPAACAIRVDFKTDPTAGSVACDRYPPSCMGFFGTAVSPELVTTKRE